MPTKEIRQCSSCGGFCKKSGCERENVPLEATQEPVAVWELFAHGWDSIADPKWMETLPFGTKLYTSPQPRKPWVGLTDEEMDALVSRFARYELARSIETKLKEKNNG